ncbi:MAG TPA: helix-turn-helix domain-containing protein [Thermodesulfobacteriota bacterium]|nr:helix-turn-helix domain-containing protein [Thermodesulfobacteriota bacterium]
MPSTFFINPRSNPELRSLHEIILLPQPSHLQDYFLGVMAILSEYFSVRYSALLLQDPQKDSLHVEALYGIEKEIHPFTCPSQKGTIGKVLESRQPMVIQNLNQEPFYEEMMKGQKRTERIEAPLLCIPLMTGDEPKGVINMNSLYGPRHEFVEDFQFLSVLSAILSPAIKSYHSKKSDPLAKESKLKARSHLLDEILEQKLVEVLNKIDPYVETKTHMGIFDDIIRVVEKILIKSALERVNHVQIAAAQFLGINRNTLRKKMKELKIKVGSD